MSDIPIKLPVRAEFDAHGGYDCMSAGWKIYEFGGWLPLFVLDCSEYSERGHYHESCARVEAVKDFIVESLNLRTLPNAEFAIDDVWAAEHRLIAEAEEESGRTDWGKK